MTLQPELMNAILSMDAYNRGYDASIEVTGNAVGSAQIATTVNDLGQTVNLDSSILNDSDQAIGFYALAYDYNGETIITYRGTDFPEEGTLRDVVHGWTLGAGNLDSEQGQTAEGLVCRH